MEDMVYTVAEVAEILKCNVNYVHKLRKAGVLPFLKLGQYKCRKVALEKFLAAYEGKDVTDPNDIKDLNEKAPSGTGIPSGANQNIQHDYITPKGVM